MRYERVEREPTRVAYARHIGPYEGVSEAFGRLMDWAGPRQPVVGAPVFMAVYHDDPGQVPSSELRSDAALVVPEGVEGEGDVSIETVPGGPYVKTLYVGPYEGIGSAWDSFMGILQKDGVEIRPVLDCMDIYLNNPSETPPEKLETELWVPVV